MTRARDQQVSLEATPFYHCMVRCVRRAFLCGEDRQTGQNFDHRKQWLVSRIRFLSYVYAIDVCAYAVMSNHYHVVLHVDSARAQGWSDVEVAERWLQLFKGTLLVNRWLQEPEALGNAERQTVAETIAVWRQRLADISWFMRGINETIARMANAEDGCSGRFWEGRFKSQALLDEGALLSCMAYVDLNPVRAQMAKGLGDSDFTSIQQRLFDYGKVKPKRANKADAQQAALVETNKLLTQQLQKRVAAQRALAKAQQLHSLPQAALMPFAGGNQVSIHSGLPFTREAYFDLVDRAGRVIRGDKRGAIAAQVPAVIAQLNIDLDAWIDHVQHFGQYYGNCAGRPPNMQRFASGNRQAWSKGMSKARRLYAA